MKVAFASADRSNGWSRPCISEIWLGTPERLAVSVAAELLGEWLMALLLRAM